MSEELKGNIGKSPIGYDIVVGNDLSIALSASYKDASATGIEVGSYVKVPLIAILDAAAAASKNSGVQMAEGWLKQLLIQYESSKP